MINGDIIELDDTDPLFAGSLMEVEDVRSWGVQGLVKGVRGETYPYKAENAQVKRVFREVKDAT